MTHIVPIGIICVVMDNRNLILKNALDLFSRRGYNAVGVQEIVNTSGITKPSLYHHFGSKQGLLEAICQERFTPLADNLNKAAEYHGDLPFTLFKVTMAFFDYASSQPDFYRMLLSLYFAPPEGEAAQTISDCHQTLYKTMVTLFLKAAENHGNMRGRETQYAASFHGLINTYIGLALNQNVILDEDLARRVVHQFQHGIYS